MIIDALPPQNKKEELMSVGYDLFCRYGVRRVSIEEVCHEAGISKVTFYKYYRNKIDFALYIIRYLYDKGFEKLNPVWESEGTFVEKLNATMAWKKELLETYSFQFVQELMNSDYPEIRNYLYQMKEKSMAFFRKILTEGQQKGELRQDLSVDFIITMLDSLQTMAGDERFLKLFKDPRDMQNQFVTLFYYGLLPRNE